MEEAITNIVSDVLRKTAKDAAAANQVKKEYESEREERRRKVRQEYHCLLAKIVSLYDTNSEIDEADGKRLVTGIDAEDIRETGKAAVRYYQRHEADLELGKLKEYNEKIGSQVIGRKTEISFGDELIDVVKQAKAIVVRALQ